MFKVNREKLIVYIHKYRMSVVKFDRDGNMEYFQEIFLPTQIVNKGAIVDSIHLQYIFKKHLEISSSIELIILFSSSKCMVRSIKLIGLTQSEVSGYIEYQLEDLVPVDISKSQIEYIYKDDFLTVYLEPKSLVEELHSIVSTMDYGRVAMYEVAHILLGNLIKCGMDYIKYVFIVNFGSVEFIVVDESHIEHFSYYELEIESEIDMEMFLDNISTMSIGAQLEEADYNSDLRNYIISISDRLFEILSTIPKASLNSENTLILGNFANLYDGVEYINRYLHLDRSIDLNEIEMDLKQDYRKNLFHIVKL